MLSGWLRECRSGGSPTPGFVDGLECDTIDIRVYRSASGSLYAKRPPLQTTPVSRSTDD